MLSTQGLKSKLGIALLASALGLALVADGALAGPLPPKPVLTIQRAIGPITMDGDLSDAGWKGIRPITTWYETNPGDNTEPKVRNVAYLAYDDRYLYAAFDFEDPNPEQIRAPLGDHDAVSSPTDYGGLIVDSRDDGKTAQMFLANPRGVQYDAVTSDATGEDNSPDFFWDSAARITATGWTLEIRVPFSSLRYGNQLNPTWGILLYRNYPRDRRYQFFSARLPRDVNCFICNSSPLTGFESLPHGSHLVLAPFVTSQRTNTTSGDLGTPLSTVDMNSQAGFDLKWNPSASAAVDGTYNPDFSQVESDAAQIVANERFALFYPEKRPFFLEGVDMLSAPQQVVYTRTVTDPKAGMRATGKFGETAYTALAARDQGGGVVIIPGPFGSTQAPQDFTSDVGVARLRRDLGRSFVSFIATGRLIDGGGDNAVFGPDFQWRPRPADSFTGQLAYSESHTPNRPDLASEWDGRHLSDHAGLVSWSHSDPKLDWYVQGQDVGPEFRADVGFIPQVGYRNAYLDAGYTQHPKDAFVSRVRYWTNEYVDAEPDGTRLDDRVSAGFGVDAKWNSFLRVELNHDGYLVGDQWLERFRPRVMLQAAPSRVLNQFSIDSYFGQEIDFDNARLGTGATFVTSATVRPGDHLELLANFNVRWLDESVAAGERTQLFNAQVERLRATWSFSSRSFVRLIGQYVQTTRDTSLYTSSVAAKEAFFAGSALFAYKLNWQTVLYAGYGDTRTFSEDSGALEPDSRQVFAKISYAWQR
jgi:hypothetical protein